MKRYGQLVVVVTLYVLVHSPNSDSVRSYDGQSKKTIMALLADEGKSGEFITQSQFQSLLNDPKPLQKSATVLQQEAAARTQAKKDMKDKSKTGDQRLDALIKYLGFM